MPNFLHRTEDIYLTSIPATELPEDISNYIQDPDLSAVDGFVIIYWVITGDVVTLMDQAARDTVDADIVTARILTEKDQSKQEFDRLRELKSTVELLVDELNMHTGVTNAILDAIGAANNLSSLKSAIGLIQNLPTRNFAQARTAIRNNIDAGVN